MPAAAKKRILNAILGLSENERVELIRSLLNSLPPGVAEPTDPEQGDWEEELTRRAKELPAGPKPADHSYSCRAPIPNS